MNKEQTIKALDRLRKDKRSFHKGTEQYEDRMRLEMILDQHLYDKPKRY